MGRFRESRALRICFILTTAEPIGGAQIHVRDLCTSLLELGHDVQLIIGSRGLIVEQIEKAGIDVHVVSAMKRSLEPLNDIRAFGEIRSKLRELKPDLISTHCAKAGWLGRLAGRLSNTPTLFTAHGWCFSEGVPHPGREFYKWAESLVGGISDLIICVSEYDRSLAIKHRIAPIDKLLTIHNGMPDVASAFRADPTIEPPTLLMIARFMKQKDHVTLLHALSNIKHSCWNLRLVGDGPLENETRNLVAELGMGDRVEFLGQRLDIPKLLSQAQAYLLISNWEGLSRSTIEALRAGLPVVVSNVGGMGELITDKVEGYLIPRKDVDLLTSRLLEVVEYPDLRARLGDAARCRYERRFKFDTMLESTIGAYDRVLNENSNVLTT